MMQQAREDIGSRTEVLSGMSALVLGGTGLIGSHIVRSLRARGCSVRVLSRSAGPHPALDGVSVEIVPGRIEEIDSIRSALEGIDLLFHAAAPYPSRHFGMGGFVRRAESGTEAILEACRERVAPELLEFRVRHSDLVAIEQAEMAAHISRSQPERADAIRANVKDAALAQLAEEGRLNASLHPPLEAIRNLRGLKRIVFTSSVTTIGRPRGSEPGRLPDGLARETDRYDLAPDPSPYFACKRRMEAAVARAANEGLPAIIVNPTLVIGEGDAHRTTGRLMIPVAQGKMPFYLPGRVNAIAAADVGEGHVKAAEKGRTAQRYILGNEEWDLRAFVSMIAEEAGQPGPRIAVPFAVAEPLALATEVVAWITRSPWAAFPVHGLRMLRFAHPLDCSLAFRELEMPRTSVREAARLALAWYFRQGMIKGRGE